MVSERASETFDTPERLLALAVSQLEEFENEYGLTRLLDRLRAGLAASRRCVACLDDEHDSCTGCSCRWPHPEGDV